MSDTDLRGQEGMKTPSVVDHKTFGNDILKHTRDLGRPPFWRPYEYKNTLLGQRKMKQKDLPEGVRLYPNVAQLFLTEQMLKMGMVELRYKDGTRTALTLKELAPVGPDSVDAGQVTEKWVVAEPGDRDLLGRKHE